MTQDAAALALGKSIGDRIIKLHLSLDEAYADIERYRAVKHQLVLDSFAYHFAANAAYRRYATNLGITPGKSLSIEAIPVLPSALFKRRDLELLSTDPGNVVKYCESSGTSGSLSIIPRDEPTLSNFLGSISSIFPAFFGIDRAGNQRGFVLGPTAEEAGDLWFSYVISCVSLMMQTEHLESHGQIDMAHACKRMRAAIVEDKSVIVIGPPFLILELSERIAEQKDWPSLPSKSYVVSAGGWKSRQRESIDDVEYRRKVRERMKLAGESSIRDVYNMVELNTVLPECEHHRKHIPPWVDVIVRHPASNAPLSAGEVGIISFLDASAASYPGFILSEDIGYATENDCPCGRKGQTLKIVRRMNNIESRGCALKMAVGYERKNADSGRFFQSFFRDPKRYV